MLTVAALLFAFALPGAAPRLDTNGDPLPRGAVARLGSERFRHYAEVVGVAVAPDGKTIAAVDKGRNLILWDAATGRELRRLGEGRKAYPEVAFTRDGRHVIAGSDGGPRMWEAATGKEVRSFPIPGAEHTCLAVAPDGKTLADTASSHGDIRLWDLASGKLLRTLDGHKHLVSQLAFAPDSKLLGSTGWDGTLRLWDVAASKELRQIECPDKHAPGFAFLPSGELITTGRDQTARISKCATGKRLRQFPNFYTRFTLSPDGKLLAPTYCTYVYFHETGQGKEVGSIKLRMGWFWCAAFFPDGKRYVTGGEDGAVRIWDVPSGKEFRPTPGHRQDAVGVAFLADGTLLTGGWDGTVRVWEPRASREVRSYEHPIGILQMAVSPDGQRVGTSHTDGINAAVRVLDIDSGKLQHEWKCPAGDIGLPAFAPDGKRLAVSGAQGVRLLDLVTGAEIHRFQGAGFLGLAFSPDGKLLASVINDCRTVVLWDTATLKPVRQIDLRGRSVGRIAFSPDGKVLAAGSYHYDPTMMLCDVGTGAVRAVRCGGDWAAWGVAFSPDGKTIAWAASKSNRIYLADAASGEVRGEFTGQRGWISALAFSRDGKLLASAGYDGVVLVWEVARATKQALAVQSSNLRGHKGSVFALSFSRDGKLLVSGSADGTALVWDVAKAALPGRPAGASFTDKELAALWEDLGVNNVAPGPEANRAALYLISEGDRAVAFLEKRFRRAAIDAEGVAKLMEALEQLGGEARTKAVMALIALGELAEPGLRKALEGKPSAQLRAGVEQILKHREIWGPTEEERRSWRAVAVLERIATPEAWRHLEALAAGAPEARLTREARAALKRRPH